MGDFGWEPEYGFAQADPIMLASALEVVRRQICGYGPAAVTCDCKFGIGRRVTGELAPNGSAHVSSESTGCPELRSLIYFLLHDPAAIRREPLSGPDAPMTPHGRKGDL